MKFALVGNDDFSIWHFRKNIILALQARNVEVVVICPSGKWVNRIESLGVRCITVPVNRFLSPLQDIKLLFQLRRIFIKEKFDLVHTMTVKLNIWGTLAAKAAHVPRIVSLVSGLGFLFANNENSKSSFTQKIGYFLYRYSLKYSDCVWFQNNEDCNVFIERKLIDASKTVVIKGSGVDLDQFNIDLVSSAELDSLRKEFSLNSNAKCVVMVVARMIWSKGVEEFLNAAHSLEKRFPNWRFILLAPHDSGTPDAVPQDYLTSNKPSNMVIVDYFREDVLNFLALADVVVLPSYYPEGLPRSLLEGMALSKPIITTDMPGCRETVVENLNGYLIPPKNYQELVNKLTLLLESDFLRQSFGKNSRELATKLFDSRFVAEQVCNLIYKPLFKDASGQNSF